MPSDVLKVEASELPGLPFDNEQQKALVGHAMQADGFFMQIKDRIQPAWFSDAVVAAIYDGYRSFYERYGRTPASPAEFKDFQDFAHIDQQKRLQIHRGIDICHAKAATFGRDYLSAQLTTWNKTRIFMRDLPQVANLINTRQVDAAEVLYTSSATELQTTSFDGQPPVDFRNWRAILEQEMLDMTGALTTGLPLLDLKLLPESGGKGSLMRGDTTVILAPTNTGKTTARGTVARHNAARNEPVLFIGREGRENDLAIKFMMASVMKNKRELYALRKTPEGEAFVDVVMDKLHRYLTFVHMTKQGLTVEECISVIRGLQARRKAQTGKGYSLLCVDYPGILSTELAKHGKYEWRQQQDHIYRQFVQLALEEKFHCLVAAQTNREGSKVNRGVSEHHPHRLLTPEDISEAYAIAMSATNILTLNRDPRAAAANRLTWLICKSRSSETGWAITCRSDYSRAVTHAPSLPATAYRGTGTMTDQIETFLKDYASRDIPEGYLLKTLKKD